MSTVERETSEADAQPRNNNVVSQMNHRFVAGSIDTTTQPI